MTKLTYIFLFFSAGLFADDFTSTHLKIICIGRGEVEVIYHRYNLVQEKWLDNFEIGAEHIIYHGSEFVPFRNGDVLIHDIQSNLYWFKYYDSNKVTKCQLLSRHPVDVVTMPYMK